MVGEDGWKVVYFLGMLVHASSQFSPQSVAGKDAFKICNKCCRWRLGLQGSASGLIFNVFHSSYKNPPNITHSIAGASVELKPQLGRAPVVPHHSLDPTAVKP
jgi:hypothetical protein